MSAARFVLHEYYENGLPIFTVFSAEYPIFKSKFKALDVEALLNLEQDGTSQILKGNAARPVPVDLDMESLPKGYTGRYETDGDQSAESDSNDSDAEMQNIDEEFEFGEFYQPETL